MCEAHYQKSWDEILKTEQPLKHILGEAKKYAQERRAKEDPGNQDPTFVAIAENYDTHAEEPLKEAGVDKLYF